MKREFCILFFMVGCAQAQLSPGIGQGTSIDSISSPSPLSSDTAELSKQATVDLISTSSPRAAASGFSNQIEPGQIVNITLPATAKAGSPIPVNVCIYLPDVAKYDLVSADFSVNYKNMEIRVSAFIENIGGNDYVNADTDRSLYYALTIYRPGLYHLRQTIYPNSLSGAYPYTSFSPPASLSPLSTVGIPFDINIPLDIT